MLEGKSIGQILEEEELTLFARAGVKAKCVTSVLYDNGSEEVISETTNYNES